MLCAVLLSLQMQLLSGNVAGGLRVDGCRALWSACEQMTKTAGSELRLVREKVSSLEGLEQKHGPYVAVIAAAGAGNGVIEEIGESIHVGEQF